ncbi:protein GVQW3-like [Lycorma delicatula]|uniref:protein GVQW3-like n=1 Tax=Lycorma delicatula TaxID=130591 RepID=UPI003F515B66
MSRKTVFKWCARFLDGRESSEDPRPGASSTVRVEENVQKVAEILRNDRCASMKLIEEITGIPKTTVHRILTENLGKRRSVVFFVSHSLTDQQPDCRDMKRSAARKPSCLASKQVMKHGVFSILTVFVVSTRFQISRRLRSLKSR